MKDIKETGRFGGPFFLRNQRSWLYQRGGAGFMAEGQRKTGSHWSCFRSVNGSSARPDPRSPVVRHEEASRFRGELMDKVVTRSPQASQ
jgi:hypothetical protein